MTTPCYYLNLAIRGYEAEVFLNGAPIIEATRAYQCVTIVPVSEWVIQGENELTVRVDGGELIDPHIEERERRERIEAGEEPEATDEGGDALATADGGDDEGSELEAPMLRVELCEGIVGEMVEPGEEKVLFALEWTPPPVPAEDEPLLPLPYTLEESGDVAQPWGVWSWQTAEVIDLEEDPTVVVEVIDFLRRLHDALANDRPAEVVAVGAPSYDEVAPIYEMDPADARARLPQAWPQISEPDDFQLAPFDEQDLEIRAVCEGRVLEPRSFSGEPFLRQAFAIDGVRWKLPIFLSKIDGELTIVR